TGSLLYSTYLGGSLDDEGANLLPGPEIATDGLGHAFVTGNATSLNFPVTPNAYQTTNPNTAFAGFLTEIDTTQSGQSSLVYSTYIHSLQNGNDDEGVAVTVDANGIVYVAGETDSTTFPVTPGVVQNHNGGAAGTFDDFIAKFDLTQ